VLGDANVLVDGDHALDEVVALADPLAEALSVGVALGETSLRKPVICCAIATSDDAGGDAQVGVAAVVAALTANPVKIIPVARIAVPIVTPSAAGRRSNVLTGCNLTSVSRPGTTLVVNPRHSTHALGAGSICRRLDIKGS
jgi:hypothetical protein